MASPFTELEALMIVVCLLIFTVVSISGMIHEDCGRAHGSTVLCFQDDKRRRGLTRHKINKCLNSEEPVSPVTTYGGNPLLLFGFWEIPLAPLLQIPLAELMELPFTGLELSFIIIAFVVFSLFSIASVCFQPSGPHSENDVTEEKAKKPLKRKQRVIMLQARQKP